MRPAAALQLVLLLITAAYALCTSGRAPCRKGGSRKWTLPLDRERIDTAAGRICREYGMRERQTPVKIFDAFMFNSELDMLEIRLHELHEVVDYFVITECRVTHQNASKPLYYGENKARFAKFEDKIIHVALDSLEGHSSYYREWDHREHLFKEGLHQPGREAQFHDLIISGDVDEIPKAEAVAALRRCEWPKRPDHHNCAAMEGSFFYFSYANYAGEWSAGPKAFVYEGDATLGGLDKNLMRYETKCDLFLKSASWHCTDCFATLADVRAKVAGFSHWEKNRFPYNDSAFIVDRTVRGFALFEPREELGRLKKVDPCTTAPPYVLAHADRLRYMLDRDPITGGYSDYAEHLGNRTDVVGNFHGEWVEFVTGEHFKV